MATTSLFSFAIAKAEVAPYNSGGAATWVNIPIIAESNVEYSLQKAEVADGQGDLQHIWRHSQRAKVTLRMKRFSFNVLETMSGSPVSSISANGTDMMYFGRDEEVDPPYVRLRLQQKSINATGTQGYLTVIVFKAQGHLPGITMREVTPGEYTVEFDSLESTTDDTGATIPSALFSVRGLQSTLL